MNGSPVSAASRSFVSRNEEAMSRNFKIPVYDRNAEPAFRDTLAFREVSNLPQTNLRFGFEPRPAHHYFLTQNQTDTRTAPSSVVSSIGRMRPIANPGPSRGQLNHSRLEIEGLLRARSLDPPNRR
jgi:hypothetical protein